MSRVIFAAIALFLLVLAGCGSDSGDEPEPTSTSEPTAGVSAIPLGTSGAASPLCKDPKSATQRVAKGLTVSGATLVDAYMVNSEGGGIWFLAAEVDAPGWESPGDVMVWAMDDMGTYSVNAAAKEFSTWSDGAQYTPPLTMESPDAQEAEFCAEQAGFG